MASRLICDREDVGEKLRSPPTDHHELLKLLDIPKVATVAVSDGLNSKKSLAVIKAKNINCQSEGNNALSVPSSKSSFGNGASYNDQNVGERLPPEKTQNQTIDKSNAYVGKPLRKSRKRAHSQINEEGGIVKPEKLSQTRPRRPPSRKISDMKSIEPQKSESKQQVRSIICIKRLARKVVLKPNVKSSTKGSVGKVTDKSSTKGSVGKVTDTKSLEYQSKIEILIGKLIKEDDLSGEQVPEAENCEKKLDGALVGLRIKVWWPIDVMYYPGVVKSFDAVTKKHMIHYVDGDKEELLLKDECWKLIENNTKTRSPQVASCSKEKQAQNL